MTGPALEQELEDIEQESARALGKNPKHNIGPHCEGCSAIGICPAIARKLQASEKLAIELKLSDKKALKDQTLDTDGRDKLRAFLKEGRLVAASYANAKQLAHALLTQNPQAFGEATDIYLKPGNEVRIVEDLNAAYQTLKNLARQRGQELDADELIETFFSVAKLTITNLNDVIRKVLETKDEEELEKLVETNFKRAVRMRQNEPSLKVVT